MSWVGPDWPDWPVWLSSMSLGLVWSPTSAFLLHKRAMTLRWTQRLMAGKKIERFGKFFFFKNVSIFFFCRKRKILLKFQFGEIVFVVFFWISVLIPLLKTKEASRSKFTAISTAVTSWIVVTRSATQSRFKLKWRRRICWKFSAFRISEKKQCKLQY